MHLLFLLSSLYQCNMFNAVCYHRSFLCRFSVEMQNSLNRLQSFIEAHVNYMLGLYKLSGHFQKKRRSHTNYVYTLLQDLSLAFSCIKKSSVLCTGRLQQIVYFCIMSRKTNLALTTTVSNCSSKTPQTSLCNLALYHCECLEYNCVFVSINCGVFEY